MKEDGRRTAWRRKTDIPTHCTSSQGKHDFSNLTLQQITTQQLAHVALGSQDTQTSPQQVSQLDDNEERSQLPLNSLGKTPTTTRPKSWFLQNKLPAQSPRAAKPLTSRSPDKTLQGQRTPEITDTATSCPPAPPPLPPHPGATSGERHYSGR